MVQIELTDLMLNFIRLDGSRVGVGVCAGRLAADMWEQSFGLVVTIEQIRLILFGQCRVIHDNRYVLNKL